MKRARPARYIRDRARRIARTPRQSNTSSTERWRDLWRQRLSDDDIAATSKSSKAPKRANYRAVYDKKGARTRPTRHDGVGSRQRTNEPTAEEGQNTAIIDALTALLPERMRRLIEDCRIKQPSTCSGAPLVLSRLASNAAGRLADLAAAGGRGHGDAPVRSRSLMTRRRARRVPLAPPPPTQCHGGSVKAVSCRLGARRATDLRAVAHLLTWPTGRSRRPIREPTRLRAGRSRLRRAGAGVHQYDRLAGRSRRSRRAAIRAGGSIPA